MFYLSVWFVTLVIQSGAMAKFWPLHHSDYSQCMAEKGRNTLSTTLHISCERGRVNPIFSTIIAKDASEVMKYVPSLCVVCNLCYSKWCYGQILAIAPLQSIWERKGEIHLAPLCISRVRRGVSTQYFQRL